MFDKYQNGPVLTLCTPCFHRVHTLTPLCSLYSPLARREGGRIVDYYLNQRLLTLFSPCSHRGRTLFSPCTLYSLRARRYGGKILD